MFANPKHRETELFAYLSGKHTFPYLLNSFLYVLAVNQYFSRLDSSEIIINKSLKSISMSSNYYFKLRTM